MYQLFPNVLVFVSSLPLISLPHFHVLIHPSPLSVSLSALGVLKVPPVELQAAIVAALTASLSGREEVLTSPHLLLFLHHHHNPPSTPDTHTHIPLLLTNKPLGLTYTVRRWRLQASRSSNNVMVHEGVCVCVCFRVCSFAFGRGRGEREIEREGGGRKRE